MISELILQAVIAMNSELILQAVIAVICNVALVTDVQAGLQPAMEGLALETVLGAAAWCLAASRGPRLKSTRKVCEFPEFV